MVHLSIWIKSKNCVFESETLAYAEVSAKAGRHFAFKLASLIKSVKLAPLEAF